MSIQTQKEQFIKYLQKNGRATATILAYSKDLDQLIEYLSGVGIVEITAITVDHLEGFKQHLKTDQYTLKSISRKLNSIKSFFKYLVSQNLLTTNPSNS